MLGIEPLDGAPDAVAAEITDALRQRVAATKGYQLLQGKDLVEVKLVFACPDAAPACMSQAGKSLGADKVIFGNVKRAGNDYQVTLKLLDVSRAVVESFTAETVPQEARRRQPACDRCAPGWLAKLSGKGGGSIQVRANFPGAAVSLDGTQVGTTGGSPVVIPDVAPGRHEVDRREERLHHDQAGVHAGRRAEPAAQPRPCRRCRSRSPARKVAQEHRSRRRGEPAERRGADHWPGPASGSRSSAPWRRPGWR